MARDCTVPGSRLPGPGKGVAAVMAKLWGRVVGGAYGVSTVKDSSDGRSAVLASGSGGFSAGIAKPLVMYRVAHRCRINHVAIGADLCCVVPVLGHASASLVGILGCRHVWLYGDNQ